MSAESERAIEEALDRNPIMNAMRKHGASRTVEQVFSSSLVNALIALEDGVTAEAQRFSSEEFPADTRGTLLRGMFRIIQEARNQAKLLAEFDKSR